MNLQNKKNQKIIEKAVLLILVTLVLMKWILGWCSIWLCLFFGVVVVAWSIISDPTESEKPTEGSPNDTRTAE